VARGLSLKRGATGVTSWQSGRLRGMAALGKRNILRAKLRRKVRNRVSVTQQGTVHLAGALRAATSMLSVSGHQASVPRATTNMAPGGWSLHQVGPRSDQGQTSVETS